MKAPQQSAINPLPADFPCCVPVLVTISVKLDPDCFLPVLALVLTGRTHMTVQHQADEDGMWKLCRPCGDLQAERADVSTMVEITTPQGPFAIPHLLRDADIRGVPDLTAELRRVRRDPSASSSGRWLERSGPAATRVPGMIPAMYAVMARSVAARQRIGTVAVTAVGMFAGGGGFGITSLSLMSLEVIVGGMSQCPRVIDGQVPVRDVLDLTVAIDHNVVDGAPAARFASRRLCTALARDQGHNLLPGRARRQR